MTSIYKKDNRTCTITYKDGLMQIVYKTDGETDIIISCNPNEKTEYDAIYFWDFWDSIKQVLQDPFTGSFFLCFFRDCYHVINNSKLFY